MSGDPARRERNALAVAGVWQRMRPTVLARLASLQGALEEACGDDALRERASDEAHKLAGSLGMFGFPEGTQLARELESALQEGLDAEAAARFVERLRALRERL